MSTVIAQTHSYATHLSFSSANRAVSVRLSKELCVCVCVPSRAVTALSQHFTLLLAGLQDLIQAPLGALTLSVCVCVCVCVCEYVCVCLGTYVCVCNCGSGELN